MIQYCEYGMWKWSEESLTQGNPVPLSSGRLEESSLVLFFCKDCESKQNLIVKVMREKELKKY